MEKERKMGKEKMRSDEIGKDGKEGEEEERTMKLMREKGK